MIKQTLLCFFLQDENKDTWLYVGLYAASKFNEFVVETSNELFTNKSTSNFFPMQWTRTCLSFNFSTSVAILNVDGQQLIERYILVNSKPAILNLILGSYGLESPGRMTDVNVFSTPISNLSEMATGGSKSCGQTGDFVNWKEANWTLHSKARLIEVDSSMGPCMRKSKVDVFPMEDWHEHSDCMQHCEKLGGRSPPVRTFEEWRALSEELQFAKIENYRFP